MHVPNCFQLRIIQVIKRYPPEEAETQGWGWGVPKAVLFFFSEVFLFGWLWDILGHFGDILFNSEPLKAQYRHWMELERTGRVSYAIVLGNVACSTPVDQCHPKCQSLQ